MDDALGKVAGLAVAAAAGWWLLQKAAPRHGDRDGLTMRLTDFVANAYDKTAKQEKSCCVSASAAALSAMGYTDEDRAIGAAVGADLGLGCGNPVRLAALVEGEEVLDLGCGAGFDIILAALEVGKAGYAIGVDMLPSMLQRARAAAEKAGVSGFTSFRLGEIDFLPAADASVDVVVSNCVINLAEDKEQVCREMYRVLRPGGRIAISDVVAVSALPERLKHEEALAC